MRIIVISLFFILNTTFALPPTDSCNMNGIWYMEVMPAYQFNIVQSGSSIVITTPSWPPGSQLYGAGSLMPWGAEFYLTGMGPVVNFKGIFTNPCTAMLWSTITPDGYYEEFTMLRIPIKIVESVGDLLIISAEPRMPNFEARVVFDNPLGQKKMNTDVPAYTWGIKIHHDIGSDLHINAHLENVAGDDASYRPNFNPLKEVLENGSTVNIPGSVVGGELTLSVDYYQNQHIEKKYTLKGTNPGQAAIEQILTNKTLRQIACQESRYKQFKAPREGGIGNVNTKDGSRGGVGIMQLYDPKPTSAETWNWRENLNGGMKLYNEKYTFAVQHPVSELSNLNKERTKLGLPKCTKSLPSLTPEQLERETLRLYNCGYEYYWIPRNAPNCEGKWVVSPSCERQGKKGYDAEYINNVMKCDIDH